MQVPRTDKGPKELAAEEYREKHRTEKEIEVVAEKIEGKIKIEVRNGGE